jgi:hypothetical protein
MRLSQYKVADLYSDYLIAGVSQCTAVEMSEILNGMVSHDKITRTLASGFLNSKLLWHTVKPMCHEIGSDDAVLIFDDSVEGKPYSRTSSLINWHYDHTVGRSVKGVNFITALYHSSDMSLPVSVRFVKKDIKKVSENGRVTYKSTVGKQEFFREMVKETAGKLSFRYVLCDSWFASAENMKWVDGLDKYFVMALKSNRKVALCRQDKAEGKYIGIEEAVPEGCVRSVWLEQLDFPVLIAKQVFKNGDGSTGTLYLASNYLSLTFDQITTIYKKRWKVEEYHKSVKSNSSFPKSPAKGEVPQQSHFIASILAFVKLERLKIRTGKNHFAIKGLLIKKATMAAWNELNRTSMPKAA